MNQVAQTLAQFGKNLGVGPIALSPAGSAELMMESFGTLRIETAVDWARLSLARSNPFATLDHFRRALEFCHPSYRHQFPLRAGYSRNRELVLLVELPAAELTLPVFDRTLRQLAQFHDRLAGT